MKFAVNAPPFADARALVDLGVAAERAGWDAFLVWDHMVVDRSGVPIVDPWVVLGALAARTERIRLGTCVTPLARRRVQKLARETATLDSLSGGRLIFGAGLGVPDVDYTTFGERAEPPLLATKLDESLTVLDGLWSGEPFAFRGEHIVVEEVRFLPTPSQRPRPPVWVACTLPSRRGVTRAARWDGIVPIKVGADDIEFVSIDEVASIADEIAAIRGTLDGFDIVVNAGPPPHPTIAEFAAAGANWWMASMGHFPGWFEELTEVVESGPPRT